MLNMGGPSDPKDTGPFLQRLFSDGEIIQFGRFQNFLGPVIAKRRTPDIQKQYEEIGGSPIRRWTETQGSGMVDRLRKACPELGPFKDYIAFRYADPLTEETLLQMKEDGVRRAVAFSQYPQFSCTTSGSSYNHLWRELKRLGLEDAFEWSVLDRWYRHPLFIEAVVNRIRLGLQKFETTKGATDDVVLVFSAHSLPMRVVNRGDHYPQEVAATVDLVMQRLQELGIANQYLLAWQSQVGPLPWLGPQTGEVLTGLGKQGHKRAMAIPIAFTSDHIETLFEIDIEYAEVAEKAGISEFHRSPSLNDEPLLMDAQAALVQDHLSSKHVCTPQYRLNCAECENPMCRSIVNPISPYSNMRDTARLSL